ncbi:hypothetical protein LguiA_019328 [Lonicera macranthoides]
MVKVMVAVYIILGVSAVEIIQVIERLRVPWDFRCGGYSGSTPRNFIANGDR